MIGSSAATPIRVYCHLRPLNNFEKDRGEGSCVDSTDTQISIQIPNAENPEKFAYDGIFGSESSQAEVFDKAAKPVINELMKGFNGTIFTYGQSATGKTYIMHGPEVIDSDDKPGIMLRTADYLFSLIGDSQKDVEYEVKASLLEIYNEKIIDLLEPSKNNLEIKEEKPKGMFVKDLIETNVSSAKEMKQLYEKGYKNKVKVSTMMNCRSAVSHVGFIVQLIRKNLVSGACHSSKLYLLDLAGPEQISKVGTSSERLKECESINKSLGALDSVITALSKKEVNHVPYRTSKLTRLLQDSLGGNSFTALILACSMAGCYSKETLRTLQFGKRAKKIINKPINSIEESTKEQ